MLANKNTQDPSCSSKLSVLEGGESAPDKGPSQERNLTLETEKPAPNFSIRDYVLTSRAKGIETNWPFKKHLLQLFLKHGIKDPLPLFEPPGLVRIQCQRKGIEPVHPVICSDIEEITANVDPQANEASIRWDSCPLLETSTLDEKLITCQRISKNETTHTDASIGLLSTHDQVGGTSTYIGSRSSSLSKNRGLSEALSEIDIRKTGKSVNQSSCKSSEKKCRLIVKLGGICKNNRAEDKTSNSSIVLDPMASKVCPVCKTFSSTSNTTLNAHIDQCLSMESCNKYTSSEFLKPQVKPEKKRLMVDIYATAPLCTLEDLDRRNGTNWATDLAYLVSPIGGVGRDEKKLKHVSVDSRGNENAAVYVDSRGNENAAVYVDSNGIKLGIVSKLNGSPQLKEELKLQKHERITEISKNVVMSKKKKSAKYLKMKRENLEEKKLIRFGVSKSQVQTESKRDRNSETHHEHGESRSYVTEPGNLAKSNKSASSKQWISSSQSNFLRNLDSKNDHSALDDTVPLTRRRLAERNLSNVCSSSVSTNHRLKISRLSQGSISSSKSNKFEFITEMAHSMDYATRKSKKMSTSRRSYGNVAENGNRRKAKDIDQGIQQWFTNSCDRTNIPSEICHSMKNGIVTSLKKNDSVRRRSFSIGARTCNLSEDPSTSSTFRKHRSLCRSGKYRAQFSAEFPRANERLSSEIEHSNIVTLSREGVQAIHSSPLKKDVSGFEKRDDRRTIMEERKHSNFKRLSIRTEYHDHDVEDLEMQVEGSGIYVKKPTTEFSAVSQPTKVDSLFKPSMVEHSQSISESDAREEQIIKMSEKQVVVIDDATKEEIDGRGIANDMEESRDKDLLVAPAECEVNTVAVQESSDCLTSHRDVQLDMNSDSDGEPCGSVISTTSSISLPSTGDPKDIVLANEQLESALISQDNLCLSPPIAEDDIETGERNVMISNQDLNIKQPAEVLHHSLDDKPFCCSCRENASRGSPILGPSTAYGSGNGKQASNLFTRRGVSCSSRPYQNRLTDTMNFDLQAAALSTFSKGLLTSSGNVPSFSASGSATLSQSQDQSISNPILRLMGKNLMVMNKQEVVQPSGEDLPNKTVWSPLEFSSTSNHMKLENFQYHGYSLGRSPAFDQTVSMIGPPSHNATCFVPRPDHHARPKNAFMNEGILADDSPETKNKLKASLHIPTMSALPFPASGSNLSAQQTFSHLSSRCHTSDVPREPRPLLQNPYISANASLMGRGSASECYGPDQFVFQCPSIGHMLSSVCSSQLRWPAN